MDSNGNNSALEGYICTYVHVHVCKQIHTLQSGKNDLHLVNLELALKVHASYCNHSHPPICMLGSLYCYFQLERV